MSKQFQIKLASADLGQLLDGLEARAASWERTADFLGSGYLADDSFVIEECDDEEEARGVGNHYREIIADIRMQIAEQGGW